MKKNKSEEAHYERMRNLAQVGKSSIKESQTRSLGTLIDTKKAANGVAYGIVKEQHKYYIKKGGLNENQNVADFAYIGGLSNITDYQYDKLSEAEKQMNMLLKNINEGLSSKMNKNGSKIESKKMLTEDKASKEIDMAASKVDDLDAATDAAEVPAEPEMPPAGEEGAAEMDAGIDSMPDAGGEMGGEEMADTGEEMPPAEDGEEMPSADGEMGGEEMPPAEDGEDDEENSGTGNLNSDLVDKIGEIAYEIKNADIDEKGISWALGTFLSGFQSDDAEKNKFRELDDNKRHEYADKILKVTTDKEQEDLGQNVEDTAGEPEMPAPEEELAEEQCSECGGFAQYAESRGYDADSIKECGEEEMTNLVSGYANANSEGQNDGDFKAIALFITPEIIEKLKGEYGHEEFANQVEPFSTEMNEASAEDRDAQINELFGGLKNLAKDAGQGIKRGAQAVGQGIKQGAQAVGQKVGDAATAVKQSYHTGELPKEVKKLEGFAAQLGQQIGALNSRMEKAGKQPINVQSILTTIKNQVASGGAANLSRYTNEEGIPVDHTEVQPMMEEDNIEEDVEIKVSEKAGKKLSPDNTPEVEMKESVEEKEDDLNIDDLDVDADDSTEETSGEEETEDDVLDLTKREEPEMEMNSGFESMGGGVVKPDGTETTTVEITKDSVNVTMNEGMDEISTGLAQKAGSMNQQRGIDIDKNVDPIGHNKAYQQGNNMFNYVNPEIINFLKPTGFNAQGFNGGIMIFNEDNSIIINVHPNQYDFEQGQEQFKNLEQGVQRKIGQAVQRIQKDLSTQQEPAMNESEKKLRKYIRNRLEEHAGIRKPSLNEEKKSETIQKLDRMIDKQFNLFESKVKKKINKKK